MKIKTVTVLYGKESSLLFKKKFHKVIVFLFLLLRTQARIQMNQSDPSVVPNTPVISLRLSFIVIDWSSRALRIIA